ncbi:MAG: MerR family transcriptional regulator [bacterium]
MKQMPIGEVARRADTPASTIRYYEEIALLPEPARVSGRRVYEPDVLQQLQAIKTAKGLGFSLDEIKVLLKHIEAGDTSNADGRELVQQKIAEMDALIAQARQMKQGLEAALDCRCTGLADCVFGGG